MGAFVGIIAFSLLTLHWLLGCLILLHGFSGPVKASIELCPPLLMKTKLPMRQLAWMTVTSCKRLCLLNGRMYVQGPDNHS